MKKFQKFCLRSKILKISISVKISKNSNFGQKSQFPTEFKKNFIANWDFWPKLLFFEILTEIEIFKICDQNQCFPKNIDWNRNFRNFWPKSKILTKNKISEIFDRNLNFSKILTIIEIFKSFDRNRNFSKILTEIVNFEIIERNRNFSKTFTAIVIFEFFLPNSNFFENFDPKQDFQNFWQKLKFFKNFDRDWDIRNFWPKSKLFQNFDRNRDFWPNRNFSKMLTEIEILEIFDQNYWNISNFFTEIVIFYIFFTKIENFDRNQNFGPNRCFLKILTQIKIFGIGDRNLNCSKIFTEIEILEIVDRCQIFRKFWSLTRFSK